MKPKSDKYKYKLHVRLRSEKITCLIIKAELYRLSNCVSRFDPLMKLLAFSISFTFPKPLKKNASSQIEHKLDSKPKI